MNLQTKEISPFELIERIKSLFNYLKSKWKSIILVGVLGLAFGLTVAFFTPTRFTSKLTFVVEESKSMGGGLAALAGQFGFDLGGSAGGGIFSGDNILLFLKSENLCRETMLSRISDSSDRCLADLYAEVNGYTKRWRKNSKVGEVRFANKKNLSRLEDSLLQVLIKKSFIPKDLSVTKPDRKASFIQVLVTTRSESFSQLFIERLVSIATKKYIDSKIKVRQANVMVLQRRADSLSFILNEKTISAASNQQALVDINPAMRSAPVNVEISTREKTMIATIFSEVVKNLEIAKSILSQETPAIEIVEKSNFPLEKIKPNKVTTALIWWSVFTFIYLFWLTSRKLIFKNR